MSEIDSAIKIDAMRRLVKALETVDVVPVVRCKDCKHFENGWCKNPRFTYAIVYGDFFCADGERRTE